MRKIKFLLAFALVTALVSCASIRVDFGNGASFELIDIKALYTFVDEYQLISGSFPYLGDNMAFESWTRVDCNGIDVVAFLPTGQTFAKITWDGRNLNYESSYMPEGRAFAQYIISDLQLCYASYESIYENLCKTGYSLSETTFANVTSRILKCRGEVVEKIVIKPGLIIVENVKANYRYEIETL